LSDPVLPRTGCVSGQQNPPSPYQSITLTYLEHRILHKVLVALNVLDTWPGWLIAGLVFILIAGISGLWWPIAGGDATLYVVIILTAFGLADLLTLISLRHWRFSFGPVGPQFVTLELPRLVVAVLAIPIAIWPGPEPALIGTVIINLGASLALVWGAFIETQRLGLTRLTLDADHLAPDSAPVRILHISDLHVERFGRREERLLQMVRAIAPDLVVLTGDYLNLSYVDDPIAADDARRVLETLASARENRVYAVLGSPSVDRNSASLFVGLPIRLLRNEVVTVDLPIASDLDRETGIHARKLALVGLDCSHDPERDVQRLVEVSAQAPPDAYRILLYHSPELIPVAPGFDVDLYLCGHTHGGQVRLPLYGAVLTSSRLGKRYEMGYYQVKGMHVYISRGVGLEGLGAPRVRFLSPPEITLLSI
jgi:predicted MPP superfamily phosphohydrolase